MSTYSLNLTLENIRTITIMLLDIFIMWILLFYAIKVIRSNARTIQIFKGVLLVLIIDFLAKFFGLKTLQFIMDIFINWGFLAFIIIFQPEIRSLLEKVGKTNAFSRITTLTGSEKENLVDQIVTATMLLSKDETGALISIEQSHSLNDYVATGTRINSDVTAELLTSIFVTSTPLHDGAVIIQGNKIACASAYFPPTNLEVPSRYGARHRAAIGISEITDAVTIIVSEETGNISITEGGKIFHVDERQLRDYLLRVICGEETEVRSANYQRAQREPARDVLISDEKSTNDTSYNTGILSKLAIKKQEALENQKIEVEEVVTGGSEPAYKNIEEDYEQAIQNRPVKQQEQPKKRLFGGKRTNKKEKDAIAILEEEASEIKLPKKKNRPAPSYPTQNRAIPTNLSKQETTFETDKSYQNDSLDFKDIVESSQAPTEEEQIYDTSKLDISKIVGLNDELDKTLNMIDEWQDDTSSSSNKGGE